MKLFVLHWLHGKIEFVIGRDIVDAMKQAGYGIGAILLMTNGTLDRWETIGSYLARSH